MTGLDFKSINELKVFKSQIYVGHLRRTSQGVDLIFDSEFFKLYQNQLLTYKIKVSSPVLSYRGYNLPPFFAGLLPEGLRLKALVTELKTSEDDLFSMLAAIGDKVIGDIYIRSGQKDLSTFEIFDSTQVNFYEVFLKSIHGINELSAIDSFSGVQEKLSASMLSFPLRTANKNKSYILKLNPKDKPNLTYNEYYTLQLAKRCGLTVNPSKLVFDKDKNAGLLVERFDRSMTDVSAADGFSNNAEKTKSLEIKIHQEDACQFLDRYPADKYRLSIQEICDGLKLMATAPVIEILTLIKLYLFNYLVGNGDFHAKNISLQTQPKINRVLLTPSYDLICTLIYGDQTMALKLDGRDSSFKRKYIIDFAERNGIPSALMNREIDKILNAFSKHHEVLLQIPDLTDKQKNHMLKSAKEKLKELSK
jgi:serine/threonine-protein kinase HipA